VFAAGGADVGVLRMIVDVLYGRSEPFHLAGRVADDPAGASTVDRCVAHWREEGFESAG
jgi:hypothetical protein